MKPTSPHLHLHHTSCYSAAGHPPASSLAVICCEMWANAWLQIKCCYNVFSLQAVDYSGVYTAVSTGGCHPCMIDSLHQSAALSKTVQYGEGAPIQLWCSFLCQVAAFSCSLWAVGWGLPGWVFFLVCLDLDLQSLESGILSLTRSWARPPPLWSSINEFIMCIHSCFCRAGTPRCSVSWNSSVITASAQPEVHDALMQIFTFIHKTLNKSCPGSNCKSL